MSSPVEHVYFVGGSWHGRTAIVGCGCYVIGTLHEVYRREPGSRCFRVSYEVPRGEVKELQRENV